MKIPETKQAALFEKQNWEDVIHSQEWLVFRKLIAEHCGFLQKEVNDCLRRHEDRKAGEALRALDDQNKILTLITQRIAALNEKTAKGE